jgi:hypothetical protein
VPERLVKRLAALAARLPVVVASRTGGGLKELGAITIDMVAEVDR